MKKLKKDVVFSVDRFGKAFNGLINCPFYEVVRENDEYVVYYYGQCAVFRGVTLDAAKNFVHHKLVWSHILEEDEDFK